jgi:hypothetical protein
MLGLSVWIKSSTVFDMKSVLRVLIRVKPVVKSVRIGLLYYK